MSDLRQLVGKQVNVEISGKNNCNGILIDLGFDILVLYNGQQYLYIPFVHVQHLELNSSPDDEIENPNQVPFDLQTARISYRKILDHAQGRFVEVYVTGNKSIHGYITSIMDDYFEFYSPVYKTMYISLNHLKWLIPYPSHVFPYSLSTPSVPFSPTPVPLPQTIQGLCKQFEGKLVIFDLGDHPNKTGLLNKMDTNFQMIEFIIANGEKIYWNLQHLKTISLCDN
jgi:hypothetical protein